MSQFNEPPLNPDDTSPSIAIRQVNLRPQRPNNSSGWQSTFAWLALLGAAFFTLGTVGLLVMPAPSIATPPPPATTDNMLILPPTVTVVDSTPVIELPTDMPVEVVQPGDTTVSQGLMDAMLTTPIANDGTRFTLNYDPFTIIKGDRPRSTFIEYTIVKGDTIDAISRRFNLKSESIAWCNDRRIIFVLRIGDTLTIPPADGACHTVIGTREETVTQIATTYHVANPLDIIDFPLNNLYGTSPDAKLPGGLNVFVPGGQGEPITWNPGYNAEKDENGKVISITFAPGQAGSCGQVAAGGGAYWSNPLPSGKWVRGFYAGHTGIDLSAPIGTPVYAANSGPVLFSGFSRWGYGNAIVIGHGPYSSLYGHLSAINVHCGQSVNVGDVIGLVGSTGNSTGPHLHFEIRFNDVPFNPSGTAGLGW